VLTEPALIEEVKIINVVIVCPNQWVEFVQCNLYAMEVDQGNMNCYNCGEFGHLARNYRYLFLMMYPKDISQVESYN